RRSRSDESREPSWYCSEMSATGDGGSGPIALLDEHEVAKHLPAIRKDLKKILRRDEIPDGVQTVGQRVLESRERLPGESSTGVWILGIARNVGFEIARTRTKLPKLAKDPNEGDATGDIVLEWQEPTQEEQLGRKEQQALALAALDELQLDDKLALLVT